MTLKKALEYLDLERKGLMDYSDPNWSKAVQLGIEALKEVNRLRSYKSFHVLKLLPSETEE